VQPSDQQAPHHFPSYGDPKWRRLRCCRGRASQQRWGVHQQPLCIAWAVSTCLWCEPAGVFANLSSVLQQGLLAIDVIRSVLWSPSKYQLVAKPLIGTAMSTSGIAFDGPGWLASRVHHTQPAASFVRQRGVKTAMTLGVCELCAHVQREAVRRWPSRRWGVIWQAAAAHTPMKDSHLARNAQLADPTTPRVGATGGRSWKKANAGQKQAFWDFGHERCT
jgi:hypothetical protein